jgi:hypothetical protein
VGVSAELYAVPAPSADGSLDVDTFGEMFEALAVQLEQGRVGDVLAELRLAARDYADIPIPMLPQDL